MAEVETATGNLSMVEMEGRTVTVTVEGRCVMLEEGVFCAIVDETWGDPG